MKKFGGIISLIILILTEIITPFSYAMEDDFLDVQEIVEETNNFGDEIIEETEEILEGDSDEDSDVNEENAEEFEDVEDEGSQGGIIEDEIIEEKNNEDISDEDEISEVDDKEEIDYKKYTKESRVAVLAEKIGIDWEAEKEYYAELAGVEGEYKGTRSQNEMIRIYFVEHIEELVEKYSKDESIEFAPETELTGGVNGEIDAFSNSGASEIQFNSVEITGSKTIDDVTVNVLAPIGSFYSGTDLVIKSVKSKVLNEIKNQLLEEQDEVTEDSTVIAFDISFIYSGEEVQPLSGTVQVSFNYETNDELKQAVEDEGKEVQVYHINDKDEEGNITENKEIEKIDIVESNEGEVIVEAESFSIYTIVTQVAEEGPKAEAENQLANFVYGEISIARPDSLSEADYPIEGFTIMDRNLGAMITGAGASAPVESYGYHYQWGNNYGFNSNIVELLTSNIKLNVSGLTGYYSGLFIVTNKSNDNDKRKDTWMKSNNTDLWNGNSKQGPCPEGWHIPTNDEWIQLMTYWAKNNSVDCPKTSDGVKLNSGYLKFSNDFYFPYAGIRDFDASFLNVNILADYWSRSYKDGVPYGLFITDTEIYSRHSDGFIRGLSVRCFKDTYSGTGNMFKITYDFNGGSGSVVNQMVKSGSLAERPTDPIKSGYNFIGWYVSGINQLFDFSKSVSEDKELFAKYKQICSEGFVDDGEQCIDENNVAYLKNGKNFKLVLTTLADGNPINYIKKTDNIIPDSTSTGNLSLSGLPVIAWYTLTEDGTGIIYYKTEASTIFMNSDSSDMFRDLSKVREIDLSNFNTKNVTRMDGMFRECSNLVEIDLSNFNTKNVTSMADMFYNCRSLTNLDVSKFDTSNVTNMSYMFSNCRSLTSLDVSKFDTSNVTNMSYMFNYCNSLTSLDVSKFDTSNVTNMSYMLSYTSLDTIDVSNFDTSNVTNMGKMFEGNSKLTMIDVSNWDTSRVTDMNSMFQQTGKLKTIYVSDKFSTQLVSKSNNMFRASSNLIGGNGTKYNSSHLDATYAHIDTGDNPGYFTDSNSFTVRYLSGAEVIANLTGKVGGVAPKIPRDGKYYTYYSDSNKTIPYNFEQTLSGYTEIYVDWVELKANIKVGQTFSNIMKGIANNNTSNIYHFERIYSITDEIKATATQIQTDDSETEIYARFEPDVNNGTIYYYSDAGTIYLKGNASNMFAWFGNLNYVDISSFNTEGVTNMGSMFAHTKITSLDLSHFDTSNVTNMAEMFGGSPITSLDISSFNTEKVTTMGAMFEGIKVTSLDLSHFDTSNVEYMNRMFNGCSELTTLILGDNFDTSNVTNMERMFSSCSKLVSLDLNVFNTENVTNMSSMFSWCGRLENVNVDSFDTRNVTNMGNMFSHTKITSLDLSNFDTSNVTNMGEMFEDTLISSLDISSFNTEKVTTMGAMFEGIKVTSLDISHFDTSNVESMNRMFNGCKELITLKLGDNFDTSNVTNMERMFANSPELESLDLSNFDTSKVTNMSSMFEASSNLKYIYVSDKFSTGSLLDSRGMFNNTSKLIGGNGTKWSSGNITGTYAKIDNEYQSGYFTDPSHFKVNFISTTGVIIDSQWLSGGDTITPLEDNTKDFIYYKTYTDSTNNELFDTGTKLYAYTEIIVGVKDKYKVEFDTMGGTPLVETQRVSEGGTATGIEESLLPHKKKYIFEGWYETGATEPFDFSTEINEDKILYAKWQEKLCVTYSVNGGNITITGLLPDEDCREDLVIPNKIEINGEYKWVTRIGEKAFYNKGLSGTLLFQSPSEILSIDYMSFYGNTLTGRLVLPEKLTTIGEHAFRENKFNGELVIPSGITKIPYYSFYDNRFTSIDFNGAEITKIDENAFTNMRTLSGELVIPDSIKIIGSSAFKASFSGLTTNTLKLGIGVTTIGSQAFRTNNFTGDLVLPENLTTIGELAFRDNKFNGELVIPSGVTKIPYYSFYDNRFTSINFNGAKITSIGGDAFANMRTLSGELEIPDSVTSIGDSAFNVSFSGLTVNTLKLGTGIITIGDQAFLGNNFTGELVLPRKLTTIGEHAFRSNKFNGELTIPSGVTELPYYSFYSNNLSTVFFESGSAVSIGTNAFCSNSGVVQGYKNGAEITLPNPNTSCIILNDKYPYNVSYVTYGGEPSDDETVLYGDLITNTSPVKTGYDFKGWYLTGDIPFNNNTPITGDLTLYALFQKDIEFRVIGNGNKILSGAEEFDSYILTGTVFNNDYEYQFTFPGIKENDDTPIIIGYSTGVDVYTPSYQPGDVITLTGSNTFYAQTKQNYNNHKGSFVSGTGVDSLGTEHQQQINIYCTPVPTYNGVRNDSCIVHSPTINLKPGYNNARYYLGLNVYNQDTDILISNDNTFTAVGDLLTYNITYILNSGDLTEQKLTYTTEEGFSVGNPIRTGYVFIGWTGTNITNPIADLEINTGTYGDLTLYANWNPSTYTILFHSNTGVDETLAEIFTYDEGEKSLTKNEFINTGYIFKGWNTERAGTGISYLDEQEVSNLTSVNNTTIDLYAQWNKLSKVVFKDGDTLITGYIVESGTQVEIPDTPSKVGYEFIKWNGLPEDMIVRGKDLIITAEWKSLIPDEPEPLTPSAGGGRIVNANSSTEQEHNSADSEHGDVNQADEEQSLYEWAYAHNITTLPTQQRANPDGVVIRGHLAKMLVNYMINVEGKELPKEIPEYCKWDDKSTDWESQEIKEYAEKACVLGVMGINTNIFDPNGEVTRDQFGTTLSRILWGDKYNVEDTSNIPYYEKHLKALKENKILEKTENPEKIIEIRKWIWMMLRRTKELK